MSVKQEPRWIAQEEVDCTPLDSEPRRISIRIGTPSVVDELEAVCEVHVEGLWPKPRRAHGSTTLQALVLATSYLGSTLEHFVQRGGKLFFTDTDQSWDPDQWLPKLEYAPVDPDHVPNEE